MKKFLKLSALLLLGVLLAALISVIYRRYQVGQLHSEVGKLQTSAAAIPSHSNSEFDEYKGVVHVHSSLGGHSTGNFDELIEAANTNDLDFVLMTEHYSDKFDSSALTLNGIYGKTLFVGGNEVDTASGDRFLLIPGSKDAASLRNLSTNEFLNRVHSENSLALITHPERFNSWVSQFDGIETFSLHSTAEKISWLSAIIDIAWAYRTYPELTLATYFQRPDEELARFDEVSARRKIVLFPGIDAHSNIGFHILGDDSGNKLINFKLDPYETTFRLSQLHLFLPKGKPLNRENLIAAIKEGNMYISSSVLGDSAGFDLWAEGMSLKARMGEEIALSEGLKLKAVSPLKGRFVVLRNGVRVNEAIGVDEFEMAISDPGTYRVEVYLDQIGPPFDAMPWIISNPIYIK